MSKPTPEDVNQAIVNVLDESGFFPIKNPVITDLKGDWDDLDWQGTEDPTTDQFEYISSTVWSTFYNQGTPPEIDGGAISDFVDQVVAGPSSNKAHTARSK